MQQLRSYSIYITKHLCGRVREGAVRCNRAKTDLKSAGPNRPWGFKSPSGHQILKDL